MTTYILVNETKKYDTLMKKIKTVAKQTKAHITEVIEDQGTTKIIVA